MTYNYAREFVSAHRDEIISWHYAGDESNATELDKRVYEELVSVVRVLNFRRVL